MLNFTEYSNTNFEKDQTVYESFSNWDNANIEFVSQNKRSEVVAQTNS
jgi:hypothetical protein